MSSDILPGESYVSSVVMGHVSSLSSQPSFTINTSLKHVMQTLVTFTTELAGLVSQIYYFVKFDLISMYNFVVCEDYITPD